MTDVLLSSLKKYQPLTLKNQAKHIKAISEQSAEILKVKAVTSVLRD
jgi:hypothetical protein